MPASQAQRPLEERARLGTEAYERHVRPTLRSEDDGKYVAVDIDTGDHEINERDYTAVSQLRKRRPSAEIWLEKVGQPTACKMRLR